jgi:hypothetical protein
MPSVAVQFEDSFEFMEPGIIAVHSRETNHQPARKNEQNIFIALLALHSHESSHYHLSSHSHQSSSIQPRATTFTSISISHKQHIRPLFKQKREACEEEARKKEG